MSQGRGVIKEVFNVVDKNLVWSEMTRVEMIWTYILNHFTEVCNMRTINDGDRALGNMVTFLALHGPKAAYAKLLLHPSECEPISREVLGKLSTAAYCIARFYSPSLNNYK